MTQSLALDLDDGRWSAFVATRPEATPFHHPRWAGLLAECYRFKAFAFALMDGEVSSGVPVIELRGLTGKRRWVALPFTDTLGPLGSPSDTAELAAALEHRRESGDVGTVEIREGLEGGNQVARGYWHVLPLSSDPDDTFRTFSKTRVQQSLARAEREGVRVRVAERREDLVEVFYRLHLETRRRQGVPIQPRRFFSLLWDRMVEPGYGFVLLAEIRQQPVAAAVFLGWNGTVIYKFSASDHRALGARPNHALLWEAISRSCREGMRQFDFGRTDLDNEGLRSFKGGWGTEERMLVYTTFGPERESQGSRLKTVLGVTIRHSPAWVCRILGETLYRRAA